MTGELTPGALARAALHDDPIQMADDVALWWGRDRPARLADTAAWLRAVADQLDPDLA